jgi:hypothetical protein
MLPWTAGSCLDTELNWFFSLSMVDIFQKRQELFSWSRNFLLLWNPQVHYHVPVSFSIKSSLTGHVSLITYFFNFIFHADRDGVNCHKPILSSGSPVCLTYNPLICRLSLMISSACIWMSVAWPCQQNMFILSWYTLQQSTSVQWILRLLQCKQLQVILIICSFAIHVFAYPWFYFTIMRSINILSAVKF